MTINDAPVSIITAIIAAICNALASSGSNAL